MTPTIKKAASGWEGTQAALKSVTHSTTLQEIRQTIRLALPPTSDTDEAIVLASILFRPHLAAPCTGGVTPNDFDPELWKYIARIALSQLRSIGLADIETITRLIKLNGDCSSDCVDFEFCTLDCVAELISVAEIITKDNSFVANSVRRLGKAA